MVMVCSHELDVTLALSITSMDNVVYHGVAIVDAPVV